MRLLRLAFRRCGLDEARIEAEWLDVHNSGIETCSFGIQDYVVLLWDDY